MIELEFHIVKIEGIFYVSIEIRGAILASGIGKTMDKCIENTLADWEECKKCFRTIDVEIPEYIFKFFFDGELVREVKV